jgi:hypothetical protein
VGLLLATRTDFTLQALRQVRDPHLFKWYAVTLLALVIYVYANEVERGRWDVMAVAPSARPWRLGAERIMSGVVKLGRYVSACAVAAALLAGCGGSGDGVTLTSSTAGPTTCTVYEPGGATQVIFASARLDVRAECEAWISRDIGAGYLWGDEPSSAVDQTPGARQVCYVKDLRGPLTASVIEDTGYRPPSALARAKGTSACADLLATSRASR